MKTSWRYVWTVVFSAIAMHVITLPARALDPPDTPIQTIVTRIPASMADDDGNPVTLDAEVIIPDVRHASPGIIWNHGFGGHKGNDRREREALAKFGYVVLSYTSRGFGDTPGQVDLMGVKEQQDLLDAVNWLIAPDNAIVNGAVIPDSIGQVGASYGGFHAWFLARSMHPAVKTVVPIATATHLYEAIVPYDVTMLIWSNGFYATGYIPEENNYSQTFHRIVLEMDTGINMQDVRNELDARAVKGRWDNIHIPVFIIQGINDSLFPANQAMEAYNELKSRGLETRLYLGGIGHPPAVGDGAEIDHLYDEVLQWLDRHLKSRPYPHTPLLAGHSVEIANTKFFDNHWDGTVRTANSIGTTTKTYYLKATSPTGGTLTTTAPIPLLTPPVIMINTYAGSGYLDEPVTTDLLDDLGLPLPNTNQLPGVLTFETPAFTSSTAIDLAGIPKFDLKVTSASILPAGAPGFVAAFQCDPKVWDVDPSGNATMITRGAFSEGVDAEPLDPAIIHSAQFDIFGAFYTFAPGHKLRITLSTEDFPYLRPTVNPFVVAIHPGSKVTFRTGAWLSAPIQVVPTPPIEPEEPGSILNALTLLEDLLGDLDIE
jgi:ABC-2 type transport system ATP-binding protein